MTARFIVADVFDGLASLETGSVDLVVTSPPFLALRSYLPADHADKGKEIGSEATPAEFIDTMLKVTAELRRVLAPHGSICIELGDTYAGGGATWNGRTPSHWAKGFYRERLDRSSKGDGWPLAKSRTLIPSLYEIALAYGINPLTGSQSPAGRWRIRNVVTWARPNPPVGALGDKWRPATSDLIIACTSGKRYWDDLATRHEHKSEKDAARVYTKKLTGHRDNRETVTLLGGNASGAPLLDYWVIPPGGYTGSHYAVFPEELVVPCVKAMCPERVCRTCGEPSRRIVDVSHIPSFEGGGSGHTDNGTGLLGTRRLPERMHRVNDTLGWSDCGHNNWRPGLVLDPFAGSGTTLAVATGHGHDAVGIDIDSRNAELARDRVGPFLFEIVGVLR